MILLSIVMATLLVQIPNFWAIKYFNPDSPIRSALTIGLTMLPSAFLATSFYSYYYGKGSDSFGYPILVTLAFATSLSCSFIIHIYILKTRDFSASELMGMGLIITGVLFVIFRDYVDNILK